ncbi:hypothetical protein [Pseudomonas cedrina]|uniref:hypothetical protein n=1 Tax=Pseudomonas cedrina TaxID=651740 RepID=UPI00277F1C50|nr:hypothetical protein [Pseudomonas cedrina]MDQ0655152.1 hypothetical protein [Pseudomonas cedrina]
MREGYLQAFVRAAFASMKYRCFRQIYEQSLFIGPSTELPDGTSVRMGNERWSNSTEDARTALGRMLREESYSRFMCTYPRVSLDCHPVVQGEAPGDVASRVAYAQARDSLIVSLQQLAEISLDEGRDPRSSTLFHTLALRHELLDLIGPFPNDLSPSNGLSALGLAPDPIGIIRSLYTAGKRKNHA